MAPIAVVSSPGITTTCTPVVSSLATTASTCSCVAPGVMTTITPATLTALHSRRGPAASSLAMIVRPRLFCSDARCAAAFEAVGPIEELEALACSCGGGLEITALPDESERAVHGRFELFPLAA